VLQRSQPRSVALSLSLSLSLHRSHSDTNANGQPTPGNWRGNFQLGHDPKNKTLGILGMGGIGSAVAHRAKAFGMTIQYHNRTQLPPEQEHGAHYVSFDTLLQTSDVLSLNLALNPSTTHILGAPEFAKMKHGVVLVNTARGALIDEAALVDALHSGKVSTCGLDVFEDEPNIHPGLLASPNTVLLPHIGTATFETQVRFFSFFSCLFFLLFLPFFFFLLPLVCLLFLAKLAKANAVVRSATWNCSCSTISSRRFSTIGC